jgi:hypothetical protein
VHLELQLEVEEVDQVLLMVEFLNHLMQVD